jgi:multidrug resistance efflux pump
MELTLAAAAQATGKGKSTLLRAVKSGKLSSRRTEDGAFLVDASELARVFPLNHVERTADAPRSATEPPDVGAAVLAERVANLERQLAREQETVDDLRKRLDRAEERVMALSPPRGPELPSSERGASGPLRSPKGLLARLWGG